MKTNLVGKLVEIIDQYSNYYGFQGFVVSFDGEFYHISGGSFATSNGQEITPIFDRDQFKVKRRVGGNRNA